MPETEHFINEGYGWACKRCRAEGESPRGGAGKLARFFREGEAEEREPRLSSAALARWRDESRGALVCTRCGAEEEVAG